MFGVSVEPEREEDRAELEVEAVQDCAGDVSRHDGEERAVAKRLLETIWKFEKLKLFG